MIFEPDIFSEYIPKWNLLSNDRIHEFNEIATFIPDFYISKITSVYYSGTFEINSTNYKVEDDNGNTILLKRWPKNKKQSSIIKIQELINWLNKENIPVPEAGKFNKNNFTLNFKNSIWSFNIFKDGNYYSGISGEFIDVAKITGQLHKILKDTPLKISHNIRPMYFSEKDILVFERVRQLRKYWENYFGEEYSNLLNSHWNYLYDSWMSLMKEEIFSGPVISCHFDMHPHNLIAKNGKISAILDFDSINKVPVGYSLAFNALKQCRQYISLNKENNNYKKIGDLYMSNLFREFKIDQVERYSFCKLAKVESLRRICFIFNSNIIENNNAWNKVLPIQIAHLYESEKLF